MILYKRRVLLVTHYNGRRLMYLHGSMNSVKKAIDRHFRADISAPTVARTTFSRATHQRTTLTRRDFIRIFVLTCTHTSTSVIVQTLTLTVVVARTLILVITCTLTLTLSLRVSVVR